MIGFAPIVMAAIGTGIEGWLCPALFKYIDEAPK